MIKNFFLFFTKKIIQIFLKVKYFRRIAELVSENLLEEYSSIKHENVKKYMLDSGFVLLDKKQSKVSAETKYERTFNQIWVKK